MHLIMHFFKIMEKNKILEKKKIDISTKNLKLRVGIFIIALIVALGAFGFGINSCVNSSSPNVGWNSYKLKDYYDANYEGYNENIYLNYYLSDGNKSTNKRIVDTFTSASKDVFSLIDSNKNHSYSVNGIGYINSHIGETVEINGELFKILNDAKEKTYEEDSSYSMFSGLIQDYWKYLIPSVSLGDYKEPGYLKYYVELSSDLSNFNLDLSKDGERYYAKFTISDEVQSFIDENKLDNISILDLNTLFYSYYLDGIYSRFKDDDLVKGYLYTHTGEMIFMNDSFLDTNGIRIFDSLNYGQSFVCGTLDTKKKAYVSNIRSFPVFSEFESEYFMTHIPSSNDSRSMFYDYKTGYSQNVIKASTLVEEDMSSSLVDLTYKNLNVVNSKDYNSYKGLSSSISGCMILSMETEKIYLRNTKDYYKNVYDSEGKPIEYERIFILD